MTRFSTGRSRGASLTARHSRLGETWFSGVIAGTARGIAKDHGDDYREVIHPGPDERFRALVRHDRHFHPPRVVQSTREEVHTFLRAVEKGETPPAGLRIGPRHGRSSDPTRQLARRAPFFRPYSPSASHAAGFRTSSCGSCARISAITDRNGSAFAGRPTPDVPMLLVRPVIDPRRCRWCWAC